MSRSRKPTGLLRSNTIQFEQKEALLCQGFAGQAKETKGSKNPRRSCVATSGYTGQETTVIGVWT